MSANAFPPPTCPERCGRNTFYQREDAWDQDMHRCSCGTFFRWNSRERTWQKCTHDGKLPLPPPSAEDIPGSFARDFRERERRHNQT